MNAVESLELGEAIKKCIDYYQKRNIEACVEIHRVMQQSIFFILTLQSYYIKRHTAMIEGLDNRTRIPY